MLLYQESTIGFLWRIRNSKGVDIVAIKDIKISRTCLISLLDARVVGEAVLSLKKDAPIVEISKQSEKVKQKVK